MDTRLIAIILVAMVIGILAIYSFFHSAAKSVEKDVEELEVFQKIMQDRSKGRTSPDSLDRLGRCVEHFANKLKRYDLTPGTETPVVHVKRLLEAAVWLASENSAQFRGYDFCDNCLYIASAVTRGLGDQGPQSIRSFVEYHVFKRSDELHEASAPKLNHSIYLEAVRELVSHFTQLEDLQTAIRSQAIKINA